MPDKSTKAGSEFRPMTDTARDTAMPAEVGGLVERLRIPWPPDGSGDEVTLPVWVFELMNEAANALEAQAAELAVVHQRYVDADEARIDAEAQLAEANKALEAFINRIPAAAWKLPDGALVAKTGIEIEYFRAARRALAGGRDDA